MSRRHLLRAALLALAPLAPLLSPALPVHAQDPCVGRTCTTATNSMPLHRGGDGEGGKVRATYDGDGRIRFGYDTDGDGRPDRGQPSQSTGPVIPTGCVPTGVDVSGILDLPQIDIGTSPERSGVVGIPTWFWVGGYEGAQIHRQEPGRYTDCVPDPQPDNPYHQRPVIVPVTVRLDVWPVSYRWEFGDGKWLADRCPSPGSPADCREGLGARDSGRLSHTYQTSSLEHVDNGGYPLVLWVVYTARISVNDATVAQFAVPARDYHRRYPVREIQSVLVR